MDPHTGQWQVLSPPTIDFHRQPVVLWDGAQVFAQGGGNNESPSLIEAVFTPTNRQWRELPSPPLSSRINTTELVGNGQLFLWGGSAVDGSNITANRDGATLAY
jgi:hypothetical protein